MSRDRLYGLELDPATVERLRARGYQAFCARVEECEDIPEGSLDLITMFHVIEHVDAPGRRDPTAGRLAGAGRGTRDRDAEPRQLGCPVVPGSLLGRVPHSEALASLHAADTGPAAGTGADSKSRRSGTRPGTRSGSTRSITGSATELRRDPALARHFDPMGGSLLRPRVGHRARQAPRRPRLPHLGDAGHRAEARCLPPEGLPLLSKFCVFCVHLRLCQGPRDSISPAAVSGTNTFFCSM